MCGENQNKNDTVSETFYETESETFDERIRDKRKHKQGRRKRNYQAKAVIECHYNNNSTNKSSLKVNYRFTGGGVGRCNRFVFYELAHGAKIE